jgi:DNA-binding CsgD family transcriptional regulator
LVDDGRLAGAPVDASAGSRCLDLLCLLRLSEIVIAAPERAVALRAMVDELSRLESVHRAAVGVAEEDGLRLRYLAHRGLPGREPHATFVARSTGPAAQALASRRLIEDAGSFIVPLLAGERALGVLGVDLRTAPPLIEWAEELLWASADYVTLALLGRDRTPAELRLTRRQRDVVFLLVEHGASNEQIADRLGLSSRTIKIHLQAAYRQLGVRTRGEAIRLVLTRHAAWLEGERARRHSAGRGHATDR